MENHLKKNNRLFSRNGYRKWQKRIVLGCFLNKGKVPGKSGLTVSHVCLLGSTESRRCHPRRSKGLGPGSSLHRRFRTCHTGGIGLGPQQKQTQYRAVATDIKEERGQQQKRTELWALTLTFSHSYVSISGNIHLNSYSYSGLMMEH